MKDGEQIPEKIPFTDKNGELFITPVISYVIAKASEFDKVVAAKTGKGFFVGVENSSGKSQMCLEPEALAYLVACIHALFLGEGKDVMEFCDEHFPDNTFDGWSEFNINQE